MGKFVKFTDNGKKMVVEGQEFTNEEKRVNAKIKVRPLGGTLPAGFNTTAAIAPVDKMYEIPEAAKQLLKQKLDAAKVKNQAADNDNWAEGDPYTDGVAKSIKNVISTMKENFDKEGIKLYLKKYTTTKNAPQWYVSYGDTKDRTKQGLPISIKQFMKKYKGRLDIFTIKGLRALQRLNASMKMWKQYSRFIWARANHLKDDISKNRYVAARFRKRAKQVIRKLARKKRTTVDQVSNKDWEDYDQQAQQKVARTAQENSTKIISKDKELRASAVAPVSYSVNNGVVAPSTDAMLGL